MSEGLLEDYAQLVKANSIQGWTNYKEIILYHRFWLYLFL